jgi:hypothetical protein
VRARVKAGVLLQLALDPGEVVAHQGTIFGQGAARVDEGQKQRLALILLKTDGPPVLVDEAEVRDGVAGSRQPGTLGLAAPVGLLRHLHDDHVFEPGGGVGDDERGVHGVSGLHHVERPSLLNLEGHRHRVHEALDLLVRDRGRLLRLVHGDDNAL